ncbi:hypothetical protein [Paraburkholderia sp. EG304]|uniref:hypothetical protein n=1 Tax=Paraburkholderia sp. EG304 TaxID=3237015 RepID=UPI00397E1D15
MSERFFVVALKWKNVSFFCMRRHLMGFLHLIGVLWNVDANPAGFGSTAYPAPRGGRFYVDFRAHFSIAVPYRKIAG